MKKKTIFIILGIAVAIIVILVIGKKAGWFGNSGEIEQVEVTEINPIDITETVSATGKIQPEVEVKLSSEVSGEIIELPVVEGQAVEKGDLLVKVNPDIYQSNLERSRASLQTSRANYEQTQASLKQAQSNYERNQKLFDKGIISKSEWDGIVSDFEVAKANKESAYYNMQSAQATVTESQDNLSRTNIYAPMSGSISKLDAELGERVVGTQQMAGTEIMRVANLANMEVEVDVNENDIVKVSEGDSTVVEVDAYLGKKFKGLVTEISNSADSDTELSTDQVTNFKVKVRILEESYKDLMEGKGENFSPFRPGMTATVDIITNKKTGILGVPISSIVIKSDTTGKSNSYMEDPSSEKQFECVFVKKGGEAKLRVVKTGIQDDANIEINSGLEKGEMVITGPYSVVTKSLKDGEKVEASNSATSNKN